jgi:hypothetical protein
MDEGKHREGRNKKESKRKERKDRILCPLGVIIPNQISRR